MQSYYNNNYNYNVSAYYASHPYPFSTRPRQEQSPKSPKQHMMSPLRAIESYWANIINFRGIASRSEYGWNTILQLLLLVVIYIINAPSFSLNPLIIALNLLAMYKIFIVFVLIFLIPNLSLTCRRLHDIGYSGWWQILLNILAKLPHVGLPIAIMGIFLIWCTPSDTNSPYRDIWNS